MTDHFHNDLYFIGCPVWTCPHWKGSIYPPGAAKENWLNHYCSTFNSVEGNSTFYGIPPRATFEKWAGQANPSFRFCFKFPRIISHEHQLVGCDLELDRFLDGLDVLEDAECLGATFLQLGPAFSPAKLNVLSNFLRRLPSQYPYAVEVRHSDWFEGDNLARLESLLTELKIDRVIFDSRPLFSRPPADEVEAASQKRKPRTPVVTSSTATNPMLRLVGRNDLATVTPWIDEWVPIIANWIQQGKQPYIFTHTPDDQFAPQFAMMFHMALQKLVPGLAPIEEWPYADAKQQKLF